MGILFLIMNGMYIAFCLFVSKIVTVLLKEDLEVRMDKNILYLFVFIFFFSLPFWDLILQKGIKTYYQVFMSNPIIYEYPEKDKNGKVESLAADRISTISSSGYLSERERFNKLLKRYNVSGFLELYMINSFKKENINGKIITKQDNEKDMGYVRVYLNQDDINYKLIKDENDFTARYQVLAEEKDFYVLKKIDVKIWDKKKNILLGKGSKLKFSFIDIDKEKFRYKFLFWRTGNDMDLVRVKSVDNYNKLFKELFGFRLN